MFAYDIMKTFAAVDIPVEKLDSPILRKTLEKYLLPQLVLPSASSVRKQLPIIHEECFIEIKAKLHNKKVAILTDESTDVQQRYFLQVLGQELNSYSKNSPFLFETIYLDQTNFQTVSQSILKTLNKYDLALENVMAFVTDNGSYMHKAYNSVLTNLLPNCRHVTCTAHIMALIAETWRVKLKNLDRFVSNIKYIFCKSPARRKRYTDFLKEMHCENVALPPSPVITRWNTWFQAVLYHNKYYNYLLTFTNAEININKDTERLKELQLLFKDPQLKLDVNICTENKVF